MSALTKTISMFFVSIVIMALLVTVILGFMLGFTHPLPWGIIFVLIAIPYLHNQLNKKNYLLWDDSMDTGIEMIDDDHKALVKLINKFQEASEFKVADKLIQHSLDEVVSYTKYHFDREERLMLLNEYPDFEAHQMKHKQMIEKINNYVESYRVDKSQATEQILAFLKTWLVQHIKGSDQEYVPYLEIKSLPVSNVGGTADV